MSENPKPKPRPYRVDGVPFCDDDCPHREACINCDTNQVEICLPAVREMAAELAEARAELAEVRAEKRWLF